LCTNISNFPLKSVRYNRVFVNNRVRYNRVFVNNRVRYNRVLLILVMLLIVSGFTMRGFYTPSSLDWQKC
jgi:hypothetical protein